jgi:hypothetical protein
MDGAVKMTLDTMKAKTARLDLAGIDFSAFRNRPLSPEALRCLRYMHDVEYHTVCYLRDLLVTRAHQDHEMTSFLTFWSFEEYWHGEAIGRILAEHDEAADGVRVEQLRTKIRRRDAWRPLLHGTASALAGPEWFAVHMSWGAVNEWTTQAGYARLAGKEDHPVLSELLRRIMRQEGRHIDFYASQAYKALESNRPDLSVSFRVDVAPTDEHQSGKRGQQRVQARRIGVGAGIMPPQEVDHLTGWLFEGADGLEAAARVDRQIDRLPGCAGLRLLQRSVETRLNLAA